MSEDSAHMIETAVYLLDLTKLIYSLPDGEKLEIGNRMADKNTVTLMKNQLLSRMYHASNFKDKLDIFIHYFEKVKNEPYMDEKDFSNLITEFKRRIN